MTLAALAMVGASMALDLGAMFLIPFVFVLVVPFEKIFPRHRGQRLRRPGLTTDLVYALSAPVLNVMSIIVAVVVGVLTLGWIPGLALRPLVALLPGWSTPIVAVLLFDLTAYWAHRWVHEVPQLWRFHAVHHSSARMDWVSGFRAHPFDGALLAPPFVVLLAAGFQPEAVGALVVVQVVTGLFLHANVRWRLRPLQRIVNTPEFHHWHHANEAEAHHTNYAALLPVWDVLFGTYRIPADRRPTVYGVDEPIPHGMVAQLRHPLRELPQLRWMLRHPWRATRRAWQGARCVVSGLRRSTFRPTRRSAGTSIAASR